MRFSLTSDQAIRHRMASTALFLAVAASQIGFLGYHTSTGFQTIPIGLVIGTLMVIGLLGLLADYRTFIANLPRLLPLLLFAAWAAITCLQAEDASIALRRYAIVFLPGLLIAGLASSDAFPTRTFAKVAWVLIGISLASLAFSLLCSIIGIRIRTDNIDVIWALWDDPHAPGVALGSRQIHALLIKFMRPSGFSSNPNGAGLLAALSVAFLILMYIPEQRRGKLFLWLAPLAYGLLITISRGALLFIVAFIATYALMRMRAKKLSTGIIILAALLPAGLLAAMQLSILGTPLPRSAPPDVSSAAALYEAFHLTERLEVWRIAYDALSDYWIAGAGFGMVQESVYAPLGLVTAAHSIPLSIFLETGLIGFILMLAVWFSPVISVLRNATPGALHIGIAAILVGLYAHQSFDSSIFRFHPLHFMFCYLIGLAANPALHFRQTGSWHVP